jgi:uncharacterized protein (TIGR00730 family)
VTERAGTGRPAVPVEATLPDETAVALDKGAIRSLVAEAGITQHADQIIGIIETAIGLGTDHADRLDLKIARAALTEMRAAFRIFAPFKDVPKVTIFGSARTLQSDPGYRQAHDVAAALAHAGWMVVTGAGPGIMEAAMAGAGVDRSIGVSIRLPFETSANAVIAGDPKLVSMKYFFTRKLMLVKESRAFVSVPGGFGTLDETFELLTLQQTGKAEPTPIVLLDVEGGSYWAGLQRFVDDELIPRGLVADDDLERVLITDSVDAAVSEIEGFYRNYDSMRWVGDRLVLRLMNAPTDAEIHELDREFRACLTSGHVERTGPLGPERTSGDRVDLPRVAVRWDQYRIGDLHRLIRALNALGSAPAAEPTPPSPAP